MKKILKRDGRKVNFDQSKIYDAINDAFDACEIENKNDVETITDEVVSFIDSHFKTTIPHVEDVQDCIERCLIAHNQASVAKAFILYRFNRTQARNARSELNLKMTSLLSGNEDVSKYGEILKSFAIEGSKDYFKSLVINSKVINAINNGDIYVKSLSAYGITISSINICFEDLFFNDNYDFCVCKNSFQLFTKLYSLIVNLNLEIFGSINFVDFEKFIYCSYLLDAGYDFEKMSKSQLNEKLKSIKTADLDYLKNDISVKKIYETFKNFLTVINSVKLQSFKLNVFIDNENNSNLSFLIKQWCDALTDNSNFVYPNNYFVNSENISSILYEMINKRTYPYILMALPKFENCIFEYYLNFTHLIPFADNKVKLLEAIDNMLNIIELSSKERLEMIVKRPNKSFENLLNIKKAPNIESFLENTAINIGFVGLFELMSARSICLTKDDFIGEIAAKFHDLGKFSKIKYSLISNYNSYVSYDFAKIDKRINLSLNKNNYSSGLFFPSSIETTLDEKFNYERLLNDVIQISPSVIYLSKETFNIEIYRNVLLKAKSNNISCCVFFVSNSGELLDFSKEKYPIYLLDDIKAPKDFNLPVIYMAKFLKL
jgi:hypothetical protein